MGTLRRLGQYSIVTYWTGFALLTMACACGSDSSARALERSASGDEAERGELFTEWASEAGIDFVYDNGANGKLLLAEIMGSGAALIDYDRDGDLDLLLLQGAPFTPVREETAPGGDEQAITALRSRLLRNDLSGAVTRPRELLFTDVTEESGLDVSGHAMGVAVGDVDNDGWPDLYITFFGPNQLWRNRGDGTFELTQIHGAGEPSPQWSTAATFFDYDRDGWLDLYVVDYLLYSPDSDPPCTDLSGQPDYCRPTEFSPAVDHLFHNREGVLEEVTTNAGFLSAGSGLGSLAFDADGDGWLDLYVANDGEPNFLWRNLHDGTFENIAISAGAAVNAEGAAEASMGLAAGDMDRDGDEDLFISHLALETSTLYRQEGEGLFEDKTAGTGLAGTTWKLTGFGAGWLDYDNDGWLDLLLVNGGVERIPDLTALLDPQAMAMPNQLFRNVGGSLREVSEVAGGGLRERAISRALVLGDLDNDGDTDAVITNNDGPVRLLLNQRGQDQRWLGVRLAERNGGRDALGARAELVLADGSVTVRWARSDGSYLAAGDPRLLFGLGEGAEVEELRVHWVGGEVEVFDVAERQYRVLTRGTGRLFDKTRNYGGYP